MKPSAETMDKLGEAAYNAYCEHRGWVSFRNEPLPKWPLVQPDIKEGWIKAAVAAISAGIDFSGEIEIKNLLSGL